MAKRAVATTLGDAVELGVMDGLTSVAVSVRRLSSLGIKSSGRAWADTNAEPSRDHAETPDFGPPRSDAA